MSGLRAPTPPNLERGRVKIFCGCHRNQNGTWQGSEWDCGYACGDLLTSLVNKWKPYLIGLNQHWQDAKLELSITGTTEAASREAAAKRLCREQYHQYEVYVNQVTNAFRTHIGQNYEVDDDQWPDQVSFDRRVFN